MILAQKEKGKAIDYHSTSVHLWNKADEVGSGGAEAPIPLCIHPARQENSPLISLHS